MKGILIKSVADSKLGGTVVAPRDWSAIEKCLHILEEADDCALLKLAKANNVVLANGNLGFITRSVSSKLRETFIQFYSALIRLS